MGISSASQQFAVAEQKTVAYGRKQQLLSKTTPPGRSEQASPRQWPATGQSPKPSLADLVATPLPAAQPKPEPLAVATDSTEEASENSENSREFNAFQTVGMVKHILAQLSSHTKDWLDKPLVAEFNSNNLQSAAFSASFSEQSMLFTANQSQSSSDGQYLATTEWELGYQALQASFSGELALSSGETISFAFDFSMEVSWARYSYSEQAMTDPLVVSLSGTPVQLDADNSSAFDLFNNGSTVPLPQLAAQQFYLAFDRNADSKVNDGSELFGPRTGQGYAELAAYDDNGNGLIDPSDDIWQYLYLWRPQQSLLSMQEAQLGAISIESVATQMPLYQQQHQLGQISRSGLAFTENGKPALVQQIDLLV